MLCLATPPGQTKRFWMPYQQQKNRDLGLGTATNESFNFDSQVTTAVGVTTFVPNRYHSTPFSEGEYVTLRLFQDKFFFVIAVDKLTPGSYNLHFNVTLRYLGEDLDKDWISKQGVLVEISSRGITILEQPFSYSSFCLPLSRGSPGVTTICKAAFQVLEQSTNAKLFLSYSVKMAQLPEAWQPWIIVGTTIITGIVLTVTNRQLTAEGP